MTAPRGVACSELPDATGGPIVRLAFQIAQLQRHVCLNGCLIACRILGDQKAVKTRESSGSVGLRFLHERPSPSHDAEPSTSQGFAFA